MIAGTLSGFNVTTPFKEAAAGGDALEVLWNTGIWTIEISLFAVHFAALWQFPGLYC